MFSSIAGIDGMIAWNLGAFLSFLLVLSTWAAEFNIRASVLLPIRHTSEPHCYRMARNLIVI
jgi:hypothetical protein